jgi:uncharacterized protein (UPF0305 family)
MSSLRMRILEYINANGNHMPYQDVAQGLQENPQRVRGALHDASNDGYLKFGRDDVSGQGGYSLTGKGVTKLASANYSVNGKTPEENKMNDEVQQDNSLTKQIDALKKKIEGMKEDHENQAILMAEKTERIAALSTTITQLEIEIEANKERINDMEVAIADYQYRERKSPLKPTGWVAFPQDSDATIYASEQEARKIAEDSLLCKDAGISKVYVAAVLAEAALNIQWQ